jgi:hypothetical protein
LGIAAILTIFGTTAEVAELVDALDLGSSGAIRGGSSPPFRINSANIFLAGNHMKRKNAIPDFSKKKKDTQSHVVPDSTKVQQPQHVPNPPVRASKPPATSMKSGRRGS